MIVLVLGSGGREHALAWRLARDPEVTLVHSAPGNPGMAALGPCHSVNQEDPAAVVALAKETGADLVVVGPEAPLAAGVVDALNAAGILAFGPTRAASEVEWSKAFGKTLMAKCRIPTAQYEVFESLSEAERFIRRHPAPLAVKTDGLAAGKGVVLAGTTEEALAAARMMLEEQAFGGAGRRIVIEEFLRGEEMSIIGICDGSRAFALAPSQDHKAAYEGNRGPNTGGMGAYSPVPFWSDGMTKQVQREVLQAAVEGLAELGHPFHGALYAGLILTERGPKVLEFNARFGDPETQVILPRLQGSLAELLAASARGELASAVSARGGLAWDPQACACVVMASPGYPGKYPKGIPLGGLAQAEQAGRGPGADPSGEVTVFHAGTARGEGGGLVSAGGRVLGVTALSTGLPQAVRLAYQAVSAVHFPGAHYRKDIGAASLRP